MGSVLKNDRGKLSLESAPDQSEFRGKLKEASEASLKDRIEAMEEPPLEEQFHKTLNLPESAEQKLDELGNLFEEIASLIAAGAPKAEEKLEIADVMLITYQTRIETDYPKVPLMQKLMIALLALFRGNIPESTIMRTFGGNKHNRQKHTDAVKRFQGCVGVYKQKIADIHRQILENANRKYAVCQQEILKIDEAYQKLLLQLQDAQKDYSCIENIEFGGARYHWHIIGRLYPKWIMDTGNDKMNMDQALEVLSNSLEAQISLLKDRKKEAEQQALLKAQHEMDTQNSR